MLRNIIKIAFRQLWKNLFYAIISIAGLSVAIASSLLMLVYLRGEWRFDRYHQNPEQVYRVVFDKYLDLGKYATSPLPVGPALQSDFPEITAMTRVSTGFKSLARYEDNKFFETLAFVDTGFTEVFTLPFISGDPAAALSAPNQLIISEDLAKKYFGDQDPMGKTLTIGSSGSLNSVVAGVFENFPQNSHFRFDIAMPFATFEKVWGVPSLWRQMPSNYTYVRLGEQVEAKALAAKLPDFAQRHVGGELENWQESYQLGLQSLLDIHLFSDYGRDSGVGDLKTLYLLALIALMVLIIAGINYVNYATARFSKRIREVSIRKVVGASRRHLIYQLIGETFLTVVIAGLFAIVLAELFLPAFNAIAGKTYRSADLHELTFYGALGLIIPLIGLIAGVFPALFLSGFHPAEALKGKISNLSIAHLSRKALIVLQFTASIALLAATFIVWRQMAFIRQSIQPESGEQVAVFQINDRLSEKFETLKQELKQQPGVLSVSAGSNMPTFYGDSWPVRLDINEKGVQMENYAIQTDFIKTMGYKLIAGRVLSDELASDVESGFVINETAVKMLGFVEPEAALGQILYWGGDDKKKGTVVGVVEDFYFQSLHDDVEPAILQFAPYEWMTSQFTALRFNPKNLDNLRSGVKDAVASIDPAWHADLKFLDENFLQLHEKDRRLGRVFGAFAALAIFISCIGLFGLAAFAAAQRTKEIGIRKILGASIGSIIRLLSNDFLRLVLVSLLLAVPIAWYAMHRWLDNFAYRIDVEWQIFVATGFLALLIAGLTVGVQGLRAAGANPVKALRNE